MAQRKNRFWRCGNGHILGMIQWNGKMVPQLVLYRQAVDHGADVPEEVDVLGPLMGRMPVRCDVCDDVRLWDISVTALLALANFLDETGFVVFWEKLEAKVARLKVESSPRGKRAGYAPLRGAKEKIA